MHDAIRPEFHSCLYVSISADLNLVSVRMIKSLVLLRELNMPLLLFVLALVRPPIPPQFNVFNLIADKPFLFTPPVVLGAGSCYLC